MSIYLARRILTTILVLMISCDIIFLLGWITSQFQLQLNIRAVYQADQAIKMTAALMYPLFILSPGLLVYFGNKALRIDNLAILINEDLKRDTQWTWIPALIILSEVLLHVILLKHTAKNVEIINNTWVIFSRISSDSRNITEAEARIELWNSLRFTLATLSGFGMIYVRVLYSFLKLASSAR